MTDIVIGKNPIKAATMELLGKRRMIDNPEKPKEVDNSDAEKQVLDQNLKFERKRIKKFKRKIQDLRLVIQVKDYALKEGNDQLKAEIKAKRESQRDFRLFREASQEQLKKNSKLQKEIDDFRSDENGYIKKSSYLKV